MRFPAIPRFDKLPGLTAYLTDLVKGIQTGFNEKVPIETASQFFLLEDTDGVAWKVTVSTAGVLVVTAA